MNALILALGCAGGTAGTYFACNALKNKRIHVGKREICLSDLILWFFSILLFAALIPYLFWMNAISNQVGLNGELFSPTGYILVSVLEWLTVMTVATAIVMPFFKKQEARDYCAFFAIPVILLNIICLKPVITANLGVWDMTHWRTWIHGARILLTAMICGNACIKAIVGRDFDNIGKRLGKMALFIILYLLAFMPTYVPQLMFGTVGEVTEDFTFIHRLFIYPSFVLPILIYFAQRNKSENDRHFILVMLALSGFIQYFIYHPHRSGSSLFPLHLCNTAMVLMLIAYAFKIKSLYYFTYFINVLGAFCAIILPNLSHAALSLTSMTYWYNHWYAFFLPLLGVALGVFERPSLKLMASSLIVFTIYVGFVFFLNSYLNSPKFEGEYNADYFYLYSDFFIDKFAFAKNLKYNHIWEYQAFGTTLKAFPVYVLTIYIVFIALTFAIWGFYTTIFNVSDAHRKLAYRKKLQRVDHLQLLKELDGRPLNTPLHPEGANMVYLMQSMYG